MLVRYLSPMGFLFLATAATASVAADKDAAWKINTPMVTYWAGPPLTDAVAQQMADGGWNLVWCGEKELDVAQRHGLRAQLQDGLLTPESLDNPAQRSKLDTLISRVRNHPALYSYFITDEPSAAAFPALRRLVAYLRQRDPGHLAYINLFPTYASNEQLGTKGDKITAYREHLRQYMDVVKPSLVSYDHYQFSKQGDTADYFLNLMMIRRVTLEARVPFLNIVQACTWTPSMRVPAPDELRYLIYTTLAYGGQGISYYVYCHPGHTGGIALADGTPTPLYHALKSLNREFVAIAKELQPLRSTGGLPCWDVAARLRPVAAEGIVPIRPACCSPCVYSTRTCSRIPARLLRRGWQATQSCGGRQPGLQSQGDRRSDRAGQFGCLRCRIWRMVCRWRPAPRTSIAARRGKARASGEVRRSRGPLLFFSHTYDTRCLI